MSDKATRHGQIDLVDEPTERVGTFLMWPQFINPESHMPDCLVPDKLFRFCDCKERLT